MSNPLGFINPPTCVDLAETAKELKQTQAITVERQGHLRKVEEELRLAASENKTLLERLKTKQGEARQLLRSQRAQPQQNGPSSPQKSSEAWGANGFPPSAAVASSAFDDNFAPWGTEQQATAVGEGGGAWASSGSFDGGGGGHGAAKPKGSEHPPTTRYRALYEFVARSEDELSFQPGDVILVFKHHSAEPGWLAGQIKEKVRGADTRCVFLC